MSAQARTTVKAWFERGDRPTQAQFEDWIDSSVFLVDPAAQEVRSNLTLGTVTISALSVINIADTTFGTINASAANIGLVSANSATFGAITVSGNTTFGTITASAAAFGNITVTANASPGIGFQLGITGATSRALVRKVSDHYSVRDFGAVGNGTTDDTAAFRLAFAAAELTAAAIYVPPGTYRLEGVCSASGRGFHIYGAGQGESVLRWSTSASSQGFVLNSGKSSDNFMQINDLTFFTAKTSALTTALILDFNAQVVVSGSTAGQDRITLDRTSSRFLVDSCQFVGLSASQSGWDTGLDMRSGLNGVVTRNTFVGWIAGNVPGFGANYPGGSYAFRFHGRGGSYQNGHPVSFHVKANSIYFAGIGAQFDQCEGAYVDGNVMVACGTPVAFIGPTSSPFAANPYILVTNNDMSFFIVGVLAEDAADIRIHGNEIITRPEASAAAVYGVLIRSTHTVSRDGAVLSNSFVNAGLRPFTGVQLEGARNISIDANNFRAESIGIAVAANAGGVASQNCVVGGCNIYSTTSANRVIATSATGNYRIGVGALL